MNGDFKIIYDRLEKFDDQNREEHHMLMEKMDEWNTILREQPQACGKKFLLSRVFYWTMPFVISGLIGAYVFAQSRADAAMTFILNNLGG